MCLGKTIGASAWEVKLFQFNPFDFCVPWLTHPPFPLIISWLSQFDSVLKDHLKFFLLNEVINGDSSP